MGKKKKSKIQIQKKSYIHKKKKNKIQKILFLQKLEKKKQFKKRSKVGYLKVRRKNSKLQGKLILWARKKI